MKKKILIFVVALISLIPTKTFAQNINEYFEKITMNRIENANNIHANITCELNSYTNNEIQETVSNNSVYIDGEFVGCEGYGRDVIFEYQLITIKEDGTPTSGVVTMGDEILEINEEYCYQSLQYIDVENVTGENIIDIKTYENTTPVYEDDMLKRKFIYTIIIE